MERRKKIMFRVSIMSMFVTAIFWGIWYLFAGRVPETVGSLKMTETWTFALPIVLSRSSDIFFAGIFGLCFSFLFTTYTDKWEDESVVMVAKVAGMAFGLILGVLLSILIVLSPLQTGFLGILFIIYFGLGVTICVGFLFGFSKGIGMAPGLIVGLAMAGLAPGLFFGLGVGLCTGLIASLIISILVMLYRGLLVIVYSSFWPNLVKWLVAAERE